MTTTEKETFKILIVDDHPIVAEGIIAVLSRLEGTKCKRGLCGKEAKRLMDKEKFDLCVIDLELTDMNGFQLIGQLHSQAPKCRILIYTMHEDSWVIAKLSTLHIHGAVSKNADISELPRAIAALRNGKRYFSHAFLELNKEEQHTAPPHVPPELSGREKEILACLSQGMSTTEISQSLFISTNTVKTYRKRLLEKLEAKNVAELVCKGKELF